MTNELNINLETIASFSNSSTLASQWSYLNQTKKNYARYLVVRFGYPVAIAIQMVSIFGFQKWQYDYRNNCPVKDDANPDEFGVW